jgi:hypothetical protein
LEDRFGAKGGAEFGQVAIARFLPFAKQKIALGRGEGPLSTDPFKGQRNLSLPQGFQWLTVRNRAHRNAVATNAFDA